jgi:hypothetical protein
MELKRWLRLQEALFYHQGFEFLIYGCDKRLKRNGDYVEK